MIHLKKQQYEKALPALMEVKINNLFARSVIEKHVEGIVYADQNENPETFYVVHPYGMSLLFGKADNDSFNQSFLNHALNMGGNRKTLEFMQVYPNEWNKKLKTLFGKQLVLPKDSNLKNQKGQIELHTRLNYEFNKTRYSLLEQSSWKEDYQIVRINEKMYDKINGSVVPAYYWRNAAHFVSDGVGFAVIIDSKIASFAFSAFVHDDKIEIGVETYPDYQKKSLAQYACKAVIDYCLEHNRIPVWACRKGNTGSCRLAEKMGFEPIKEHGYYKLSY